MAQFFSKAFRQGRQPSLWKLASVVPVHKKDSKSATKNYRPISLLPILSKVMEAIINRSFMGFLEHQHMLTTNQYGFRSGLGTQDLLTLLHHHWSTVAAGGGAVRVVAVDIAGAFVRVSHPGVIHKAQQYGVSGMLLAWLGDYLLDKLLGVTLDSQLSHRNHLRTIAIRARKRLGLLRKASPLLDSRSRATVYRGFVRPVMEYCPLVWMGAADCHLQRLDQTQRSALHLIGPGAMLQSLSIRRMVATCTYIYKLLCSNPTSPLRQLLPPSQAARPAHVRPSRLSLSLSLSLSLPRPSRHA